MLSGETGNNITIRLAPERLAEIRAIVDERMRFRDDGGFVTHSEMDLVLLLAELDAVTRERDEARQLARVLQAGKLPTLENMRDANGRAPWDCPECGVGSPNHAVACPRVRHLPSREAGPLGNQG